MTAHTNLIQDVEIKYFRSIYRSKIVNPERFCVISGPNDVGKSNFLKALNLFFTGSPDLLEPFDFDRNFNFQRKEEVRKETVKGRQFIQIKITFNRGKLYPNTLPKKFWVRKTWYRGDFKEDDDIERQIKTGKLDTSLTKAQRSLNKFLNKMQFNYIPAIKDRVTFSDVLEQLQSSLFEYSTTPENFAQELQNLNIELARQAEELQEDFLKSTEIPIKLGLPSKPADLFQAFRVDTGLLEDDKFPITLDYRGDGMRVRFIPAILNYIASHSRKHHIWGFEEPENSMEFKRAFELFEKCRSVYSKNAQIFVTSHSPAFIDLKADIPVMYLVTKDEGKTDSKRLDKVGATKTLEKDPEILLAEELGHIALLSDLHDKMSDAIKKAELVQSDIGKLKGELSELHKPIVLTEGKTDVIILKEAWERLYKDEMPFHLKPCDVYPESNPYSSAGHTVLKSFLTTVLPDSQQIFIGIFDRDKPGIQSFILDKNFKAIDLADPDIKKHLNDKAYAMLLPIPDGKEDFGNHENLPIEMMFDNALLQSTGLLKPQQVYRKSKQGNQLPPLDATEPFLVEIPNDKKKHFAEDIVPTFSDQKFAVFEPLFDNILNIINNGSG